VLEVKLQDSLESNPINDETEMLASAEKRQQEEMGEEIEDFYDHEFIETNMMRITDTKQSRLQSDLESDYDYSQTHLDDFLKS
jgi:hypothetical protein